MLLQRALPALPEAAVQELRQALLAAGWQRCLAVGSRDVLLQLLQAEGGPDALRELLESEDASGLGAPLAAATWDALAGIVRTVAKNLPGLLALLGRRALAELPAASACVVALGRYAFGRQLQALLAQGLLEALLGVVKPELARAEPLPAAEAALEALATLINGRSARAPAERARDELLQLQRQLASMVPSDAGLARATMAASTAIKVNVRALSAGGEVQELPLCARCRESPRPCFGCDGLGRKYCPRCSGCGEARRRPARGTKAGVSSKPGALCRMCKGAGTWPCSRCDGKGTFRDPRCQACLRQAQTGGVRAPRGLGACPADGLRVAPVSAAELSAMQKLWGDRDGSGAVLQAWSINNPKLAWVQEHKRRALKQSLGQEPEELQGFHGTAEENILSIALNGFDAGRRCGQAFGAGEYFAKCPDVSKGYCRGGRFMLVCKLLLGKQASDEALGNGDHIWVPHCRYYVISSPEQVLPLYILRWDDPPFWGGRAPPCVKLERVLATPGGWSSLEKAERASVPPNRPCAMTAEATDALWIGYLRPDLEDAQLEASVRRFLEAHGDRGVSVARLQVVRGKFTQAKAQLRQPVPKQLVVEMNSARFEEDGAERTVTVDDAHGSPGQRCPRTVAGYCRGRNLRFVDPCWCSHDRVATASASYELLPVDLGSAKGDEIVSNFSASAPFHDGCPRVLAINAIQNPALQALHENYRAYLRQKNGEEPKALELYHGTNNEILDTVYTHGLAPPSDTLPSESCPRSGGKGLCTSLCDNSCEHCVERHAWDRCHMFGLGVYLADLAQKSHRYCSRPVATGEGRRRYRMVLCSVLSGRTLQLEAHLAEPQSMHDLQSLRACYPGDLERRVRFAGDRGAGAAWPPEAPVEQHDLLFVKGLGARCCHGLSVVNSEYVSFHPYQCLPRYEIVYEV